jgi:iron complex outermembrane recepter protein
VRLRCASRVKGASALLALCLTLPALAQQRVESVTVTATRTTTIAFNVPASVDSVDGETLRTGQLQVNLSEALARVPGVNIQNRGNDAQDLQISSRGYGARASFGVRGIKVLVDGIPVGAPDGAGQVASFALGAADRVEVLRGPFSALYGNASGGVIQLITLPPVAASGVAVDAGFGAHGISRISTRAGVAVGEKGALALDAMQYESDGFRPHSASRRSLIHTKGEWVWGAHTVTLLANHLDIPNAQDALGLTRTQLDQDPDQTAALATQFNTRKSTRQSQFGGTARWQASDALGITAMAYTGARVVQQFQAIAAAAQTASTHPGGVIDLARRFHGADIRAEHSRPFTTGVFTLAAGASIDRQHEARLGFQNFVGTGPDALLGMQGVIRRDEINRLSARDLFAQADWRSTTVNIFAGARKSWLNMLSSDRYITAGNGDDTGALTFTATTPVAGASLALLPNLRIYASAGRGFETPTFNEAAYRADGQSGLNFDLRSSTSRNSEIGVKWRAAAGARATLAVFQSLTANEIASLTNSGGRSVFRNVGRTTRTGVESTLALPIRPWVDAYASASTIAATYRDAFVTCGAPPCTTPNIAVARGSRIPGVPRAQAFFELRARPTQALTASVELAYQGQMFANDTNSESTRAAALANAMLVYHVRGSDIDWTASLRAENLTNKRGAATVIVNEANARFFEPRAPRSVLFSLAGRWR